MAALVLIPAQRAAVDHVTARATLRREEALARLGDALDVAAALAMVAQARVSINFHPDRLLHNGRTVAEAIAAEGVYRGQFETGISNGGRSAYPGGDRDRWEEALFGGAYHVAGVVNADRPKYGSLNVADHPDGASPRFGSCHLRLHPEVNARCTFTDGDSHLGPADIGTLAAFECVLAGQLERSGWPPSVTTTAAAGVNGRVLDGYIEAQVHGPLHLDRDVEAIVLDPSFRGTPEAELLAGTGRPIRWHYGFELRADEYGDEFRGPEVPPLARAVEERFGGEGLDAAVVGRVAAAFIRHPEQWRSFGEPDELLQYAKYLWHTLVHFGRPVASPIR
jgi:hypothetical protein